MISRRLFLAASASGFAANAGASVSPTGLHLIAQRSTNTLVFMGDGQPIMSFHAAFGREDGAKRLRDDARTPIGEYLIRPARASGRWRWFHPIDYPNARDIAEGRAQGLPKAALGDEIGLHGYGGWPPTDLAAAHGVGWNWTSGCIAVNHQEIEIIRALIQRPIPITIEP